MKKAQDRASIIEDALGSFEWLSQVGVWSAFVLAGASFLFWAGLDLSVRVHLSFVFLCATTFPLRNPSLNLQSAKVFAAILGFLAHAFILQNEYDKIPSVLLIIPAFLFAECIQGWIWKILFTGALWSMHIYWSGGFNRATPFEDYSSSLLGAGVTLFLVGMFSGIHWLGKRSASQKLEKLKGKIDFKDQRVHASRLQILGELSAALVHELSTPVTNLQGFFTQMTDSEEFRMNVQMKEIQGRMEANLLRMRDLLLGFRSFSRMSPTENVSFKSSELFRDLELLSRHAFQSNQVELKIIVSSDEIEIAGNRVEIGQVMMNFLLNAMHSVKKGKVKKVMAGCDRNADGLVLFVEDTGTGVPEDLRDKIFRPFFSTKGDEGSGLGLYISKIIAEHHDGKILVTDAQILEGKGARFELHFPVKRILTKDLDQAA